MRIIYTKTELIKETSEKSILKAVSGEKTIIVKEFSEDKREIYTLLKNKKIPGVPEIYSVELNDRTVITEEYIDGISLYDFISTNKIVSLKTALKIAVETATIISNLHSIGIIHRDITPSNIFISNENKVYIVDFDIARTYKPEAPKDTQLLGTVGYAPPEQFGFGATDYKSDIYAFGMSMKDLFFLVKEKHSYTKIFEKCTSFDPERRYKNMDKVVSSLNAYSKRTFIMVAFLIAIIFTGCMVLSAIKADNSSQNSHNKADNSSQNLHNKADNYSQNSHNIQSAASASRHDKTEIPHKDTSSEKDLNTTTEINEIVPPEKGADAFPNNVVTGNESKSNSDSQITSSESVSNKNEPESQSENPNDSETKVPDTTPQPVEYKCFFCGNPPITVIGQNRYCAEHAPKCTSCGSPLTSQNSGLCESCAFKTATDQNAK